MQRITRLLPLVVFAVAVTVPQLDNLFPYSDVLIGFLLAAIVTFLPGSLTNNQRDDDASGGSSTVELDTANWDQRKFHNERIYWNFEHFIKATLAVGGGLAFLSVNIPDRNTEFFVLMIKAAGVIELFVGLMFSLNIWSHYMFKVRKLNPPEYNRTLSFWQQAEVWIITAILTISIGTIWLTWHVAASLISGS